MPPPLSLSVLAVVLVSILVAFGLGMLAVPPHDHATIAGLDVPAVHCAEDEVIGWIGVDTLGCINYEEVD